jgi:putative RNA 2'-phosphotransferase
VDLGLPGTQPPTVLYHGTVSKFLPAMFGSGLKPMKRPHVRLSTTIDTATTVDARRGLPVVLRVDAGRMAADGHVPRQCEGLRLTDHGPVECLSQDCVSYTLVN